MSIDSGQSTSIWMAIEPPHFDPLTTDLRTDVCVIGARIPRGSVTRALYWDTADPYH